MAFAQYLRRVTSWLVTALAAALVLFALNAPTEYDRFSLGAFTRIPVEALVLFGLVLLLPRRAGRLLAGAAGLVLGLLTLLKVLDLGFYATLERPFDLVLDWHFLGNAKDYLTESMGRWPAIGIAFGTAVLAVVVVIAVTGSVLRLTRLAFGRRAANSRAVAALGAIWVGCAVLGARFGAGEPIASHSAVALIDRHAVAVNASLHDRQVFARQIGVDPFDAVPADQLLTGLQGKDVILTFVESYGRSAVEDPKIAPGIDAVLDSGTAQLQARGFAAKSGWLTSSTAGGGSWLAHSTLLSGLWVDNEQRYDALLKSRRLTLSTAFEQANWRTVTLMPDTNKPWPEGAFYGYDKTYATDSLDYQGPTFGWAAMPDQYTLSELQRTELAPARRRPVLAEVDLVSSHSPWAPVPSLIDWDDVGDGAVFDPMPATGKRAAQVWRHPAQVPIEYGRSIQYSLSALISYLQKYGTDNTVMIFLGDHQPASIVTGVGAGRDVPITIVARDPAVLNLIAGWGWQDGLKPGPSTPVWPMSAFRDKFLAAFSSLSAEGAAAAELSSGSEPSSRSVPGSGLR